MRKESPNPDEYLETRGIKLSTVEEQDHKSLWFSYGQYIQKNNPSRTLTVAIALISIATLILAKLAFNAGFITIIAITALSIYAICIRSRTTTQINIRRKIYEEKIEEALDKYPPSNIAF